MTDTTPVRDAHTHFFSQRFFEVIASQVRAARGADHTAAQVAQEAELDGPPPSNDALADRWVEAFDAHGIAQAVTIASVPGDAESVLAAATRHPTRFIPYAMVHPAMEGSLAAAEAAAERGLAGLCLFPSMHGLDLASDAVVACVEIARRHGLVVFVHCGVLQVGIRRRLGLGHPFDIARANPLHVASLAARFPDVTFVLPHFGAGFFREALLVGAQLENVYFDTASANTWTRTQPSVPTLDEVFERALGVVGPQRILYGSDSSAWPRGYRDDVLTPQRVVLEHLLSADERALVLGANLERLVSRHRVAVAE